MSLSSRENFVNKRKAEMDWLLESPKRRKTVAKRTHQIPPKRKGRPSIAELFPTAVETAKVFIESNGFKAHRGRADDIGTCGSTIPAIKEHLFPQCSRLERESSKLG